MVRLRDPDDGCPWDQQQTMRSVVPHTLEECYELVDAIERDDITHVREELGDLLFQVIFYARIGEEGGHFTLDEVVHELVAKLIRRHPHVFPGGTLQSRRSQGHSEGEQEVKGRWERIKAAEREGKAHLSLMDDVPAALPALTRARKLQKRAAQVTFDWYDPEQVLHKLQEELGELAEATEGQGAERVEDEAGDVLFSVVNYLRHIGVDAETALRRGNDKFARRFRHMEVLAERDGRALAQLDDSELDALWERVKSELS